MASNRTTTAPKPGNQAEPETKPNTAPVTTTEPERPAGGATTTEPQPDNNQQPEPKAKGKTRKKVITVGPVKFEGEVHEPGTELELSERDANELVACGAAKWPPAARAEKK